MILRTVLGHFEKFLSLVEDGRHVGHGKLARSSLLLLRSGLLFKDLGWHSLLLMLLLSIILELVLHRCFRLSLWLNREDLSAYPRRQPQRLDANSTLNVWRLNVELVVEVHPDYHFPCGRNLHDRLEPEQVLVLGV